MDNRFEFSLGAVHQTTPPEELGNTRVVHSKKLNHSGLENYKYGYVNDVIPCGKCNGKIHG